MHGPDSYELKNLSPFVHLIGLARKKIDVLGLTLNLIIVK